MSYFHIPVMLKEVLEYLHPQFGEKFIDGTLGGASYTLALAQAVGEKGRILSIDLDPLAIDNARKKIGENNLDNIILVSDNFKNIKKIAKDNFPNSKFAGLVLDLGLSSAQLADEGRGFSFQGDRPLDMAFGFQAKKSTREILNTYAESELTRIFKEYGEEVLASNLAREIVNIRKNKKFRTTGDLMAVIKQVIPNRSFSKTKSATKIFQALRIETNQELEALKIFLEDAPELLETGGRLVIISFQSGEDRLVKNFFKNSNYFQVLNKKPLSASRAEINMNPRARSAKLRAALWKGNN